MAHTFVVGADLFSFANSDWELVKRRVASPQDSAVAKGGDGEFILATVKTFNARTEVVCDYRAKKNTAALAVAVSLGLADPVSGYVPTSVAIRTTNTGHAEISITGHMHGASTHELNQVDVSVTADGFGATDFLSAAANEGCQNSNWSASIEHKDAQGKGGDFLCGRSQACRIEASATIIADAAPALDASWTDDGSEIVEGDDFYTANLKAHKFDTP
jgi:hypothetical protein